MNKITTLIGLGFAIFFLVGLATTLTRSMLITVLDMILKRVILATSLVGHYANSWVLSFRFKAGRNTHKQIPSMQVNFILSLDVNSMAW